MSSRSSGASAVASTQKSSSAKKRANSSLSSVTTDTTPASTPSSTELSILLQLNHHSIVKIIEVRNKAVYTEKNGNQFDCLAIVLEYARGGELIHYLMTSGQFQPDLARTYFFDLLEAVEHIHNKGIVHRDLKPENIVLDHNFSPKLIDFGFAIKVVEGERCKRKLGTEGYMAPEVRQKDYDPKKADMFSLGVILFILYSGSPPFEKSEADDPKLSNIR